MSLNGVEPIRKPGQIEPSGKIVKSLKGGSRERKKNFWNYISEKQGRGKRFKELPEKEKEIEKNSGKPAKKEKKSFPDEKGRFIDVRV